MTHEFAAQPSYRHRLEHALRHLRGDWIVAVLIALAGGPRPFMMIQTEINRADDEAGRPYHPRPLSRRILSLTLKRLIASGLIENWAYASTTIPPTRQVWYGLTPHGRAFLAALRPLAELPPPIPTPVAQDVA
jgi:DNA-binding HxlR family transcriptional regulator